MGTLGTPGAVTVVPIYWDPTSSLAPAYKSVINGFVTNVAADSGALTNVFSVLLQYGIHYDVQAGAPITDTDPFPPNGCTPDTGSIYGDNSGYTSCLTNAQIQSEVTATLSANSLPSDLAHLYVVFLPKGVESCSTSANGALNGTCSVNGSKSSYYCGYHGSISNSPPIYAVLPFPIYNSPTLKTCSSQVNPGNESPNGELDADVAVSTLSGEMTDAITDPEGTAWYDRKGKEIGFDCQFFYGSVLGGVTPGGLFNQIINGGHYFLQEELSNEDYLVHRGTACIQRVDLPIATFRIAPRAPRAGKSARFNAKRSRGSHLSYAWSFGDNSSGTGVRTSHAYTTAGTYTVTLTITDTVGLQDTTASTSHIVTVR